MTELANQTMNNRVAIVLDLNSIIAMAESQITRAKGIPILNDAEHADWVQGYADRIHEICLDMADLVSFGHRGGDNEA